MGQILKMGCIGDFRWLQCRVGGMAQPFSKNAVEVGNILSSLSIRFLYCKCIPF
jgi:hypothetical protein